MNVNASETCSICYENVMNMILFYNYCFYHSCFSNYLIKSARVEHICHEIVFLMSCSACKKIAHEWDERILVNVKIKILIAVYCSSCKSRSCFHNCYIDDIELFLHRTWREFDLQNKCLSNMIWIEATLMCFNFSR